MKPTDFVKFVNERISIGYPFKAWGLKMEVKFNKGHALLVTSMRSPHGDGGSADEYSKTRLESVPTQVIRGLKNEDDALFFVHFHLAKMIMQRVEDALYLDGIRVFDPHANDKPPQQEAS